VSETDRNGNTLSVDAGGIHSSNGESITFSRDAQNRITTAIGPSGQHLAYTYSAAGDLASSTDSNGNTTTYTYTGDHLLTSITGPGGVKPFQQEVYDAVTGRLTEVIDGDGNVTKVSNDVAGQTQTIVDPNGQLTTKDVFDDLGDLVQQSRIFGGTMLTTRYTYDAQGRVTSETDPMGRTYRTSYDDAGDVTQLTDPQGRVTSFTYDAIGDPLTISNDGGTIVTASYDANGNRTTLTSRDGSSTEASYNSAGEPTLVTDQLGRTTQLSYDSLGHPKQQTDPTGGTTLITSDASGRVTSVTDAVGAATSYAYDDNGNLLTATDALGRQTKYTYDSRDDLLSVTDPSGRSTTYTYDGVGRVLTSTDRDGITTTYTYNADGQPLTEQLSSGDFTKFAYDPLGRLTSISNETAQIAYGYNADGQVVAETESGVGGDGLPTVPLTRTYDNAGRLASTTRPDGTVGYTYDSLGRLSTIADPAGRVFAIGYDPTSRPHSLTEPNGISQSFTYDPAGQLTGLNAAGASGTVDSLSYVYGLLGLRHASSDPSGTTNYTYDPLGQLTQATYPAARPSDSYTYDAAGNRASSATGPPGPFAYNNVDELLSDGSFSYTYDNDGRLVKKVQVLTGATTRFNWNGRGQLVSIQYPDGTSTTYRYDPLGRRVDMDANGQIRRYGYDGPNIALEYDQSNALAASYVDLPGADHPLEMVRGGTPYYYLQDANGNVVGLTNSAGTLVASYEYDAFGGLAASTGSVDNPFTFAGREYDPKSGLYYDRLRYYDPTTGRFISQDPINSPNPYLYASGSPPNYVDPSGAQIAEYAALLQDQIGRAKAIATFARCVALGLLVGLATGNADAALYLVHQGLSALKGIVPYSDYAFGSDRLTDTTRDVYDSNDKWTNAIHTWGSSDPLAYEGGDAALRRSLEQLDRVGKVSGWGSWAFSLLDLEESLRQLKGCGCD
jgi:RHS repeat-associated protein